ncbi:MAG: hypothetical protein FWF67_04445 [Fibromonadales bacterium]|nr:hypothetical protein [Fibromonadales bacterium]
MVFGISVVWIIGVVFLQILLIIGGILFFNVHIRKQITKDTEVKPVIDKAYREAEKTRGDDEDLGGTSEHKAS